MTDQKKNEATNEDNATEKGFNCCSFENMSDMMKNMCSDEDNQVNCKEMMQKMCDCISDVPQKK